MLSVSLSSAVTALLSVKVKEADLSFPSKGATESDLRVIREKCDDKEREDINDKWSSARALSRTKHMDCLSFLWNSSHMKTYRMGFRQLFIKARHNVRVPPILIFSDTTLRCMNCTTWKGSQQMKNAKMIEKTILRGLFLLVLCRRPARTLMAT